MTSTTDIKIISDHITITPSNKSRSQIHTRSKQLAWHDILSLKLMTIFHSPGYFVRTVSPNRRATLFHSILFPAYHLGRSAPLSLKKWWFDGDMGGWVTAGNGGYQSVSQQTAFKGRSKFNVSLEFRPRLRGSGWLISVNDSAELHKKSGNTWPWDRFLILFFHCSHVCLTWIFI